VNRRVAAKPVQTVTARSSRERDGGESSVSDLAGEIRRLDQQKADSLRIARFIAEEARREQINVRECEEAKRAREEAEKDELEYLRMLRDREIAAEIEARTAPMSIQREVKEINERREAARRAHVARLQQGYC
jgi:hypothetical protein